MNAIRKFLLIVFGVIAGAAFCVSALSLADTHTNYSGGGSVTWPATTDLVISNATNSPAGLAPINGDCVVGSAGAWTAGACGGSPGGSSTQVQYNSSGSFAGSAKFTFTGSSIQLGSVTGDVATLNLGYSGAAQSSISSTGSSAMSFVSNGDMTFAPDGNSTSFSISYGSYMHTGQEIDKSYSYNTPTTGATVTISSGKETAIINPSGTLAALTVALPGCTSGYDGSIARFASTQIITTLTVTAASGSVVGAVSTLALGRGQGFICDGTNTTWYPTN
jgi:hypothetical protein